MRWTVYAAPTPADSMIPPAGVTSTASTIATSIGPNFLIYHAMGPNLADVFGTALADGIMLALLK